MEKLTAGISKIGELSFSFQGGIFRQPGVAIRRGVIIMGLWSVFLCLSQGLGGVRLICWENLSCNTSSGVGAGPHFDAYG